MNGATENDALIDVMISADCLSADVRRDARIVGSSQREPFVQFADAILAAGYRNVEVTEDMVDRMVDRAADAIYNAGMYNDLKQDNDLGADEAGHYARAAVLSAVLGGDDK